MSLTDFYNGFWITEKVGNNAFSFEQRRNQKIYVPSILSGSITDVVVGDKVVFSEIEDGIERNVCGLANFVYFDFGGKPVFIFDNHNHAFFFWLYGLEQSLITKGGLLIHVDQHTDMRAPENFHRLPNTKIDLRQAFEYTNFELNVGNFIKPALKLGLFSQVEIIDSQISFEKEFSPGFALDLDMDIFSDDMNYIEEGFKKERIKKYIAGANFITIATSPYFMPQEKAIRILRELF